VERWEQRASATTFLDIGAVERVRRNSSCWARPSEGLPQSRAEENGPTLLVVDDAVWNDDGADLAHLATQGGELLGLVADHE
jgi:hypothetical protein